MEATLGAEDMIRMDTWSIVMLAGFILGLYVGMVATVLTYVIF